MFISIKGFGKLTNEQQDLLLKINKKHIDSVGKEYKTGIEVIETWIDSNDIICVKLRNGEWYHYYENGTWG